MNARIGLATLVAVVAGAGAGVAGLVATDAGSEAVAASTAPYEVWLLDQNDTRTGLNRGGFLHIYSGPDLERDAAAAQPETIDLGAEVSDRCQADTGAVPVRPHMVAFNGGDTLGVEQGRFAIISWVVSGHVTIHDARTRELLTCIRTSAGAGGARQAHAAFPTPDGKHLVVANQNGKLVERIATNWETRTFALEPAASLSLSQGSTPGGAAREDATLRPDNAPICVKPTADGKFSFISLRGGGAFVVDHNATPIQIVAEYDRATIADNGCGQIEAAGKMFVNSGAGAPGNADGHNVYGISVAALSTTPAPPNTPAPQLVYSRPGVVDGHGFALVRGGTQVLAVDRERNDVSVIDAAAGTLADRFALEGGLGDDPAPDLLVPSPDGKVVFASLRGPQPLSGGHTAIGESPGVGVIRLATGDSGGKLASIAPARRSSGTPDPHGIAVRVNHVVPTPTATATPAATTVPPVASPTPFSLTASAPTAARAGIFRRSGLAVRTTVSRPSRITARLRVSAATARRLGTPTTLAAQTRTVLKPGTYTLRLKPTRRAAPRLTRVARYAATLQLTARDADGRATTTTRTVTLSR